jgi:hypothetical protein
MLRHANVNDTKATILRYRSYSLDNWFCRFCRSKIFRFMMPPLLLDCSPSDSFFFDSFFPRGLVKFSIPFPASLIILFTCIVALAAEAADPAFPIFLFTPSSRRCFCPSVFLEYKESVFFDERKTCVETTRNLEPSHRYKLLTSNPQQYNCSEANRK